MAIGQSPPTTRGSGRSSVARVARYAGLLLVAVLVLSAENTSVLAQQPARSTGGQPSDIKGLATAPRVKPVTPSAKLTLYPPRKVGCHHLVDGKWEEVPCASAEDMKKIRPPQPANSIQSVAPSLVFFSVPAKPLVWGSVAINFLSDPTQATETSQSNPRSVPSTGTQPNSFSIQLNTNTFTCTPCSSGYPFALSNAGDQGWVQFTYQECYECLSDQQTAAFLCVSNWDLTSNVSSAKCVQPSAGFAVLPGSLSELYPLTGPGSAQGAAEVIGFVTCPLIFGNPACLLQAIGYLPWAGGWWSVTWPDQLGLNGNWTNVNGTILGNALTEQAVFTNTQIQQLLRANACFVDPQDASGYAPQPCSPPTDTLAQVLSQLYATPVELSATSLFVSGETNNLINGSATFQCDGPYDCWLSYNSNSQDLGPP